jgi:hypothetical protein
MLAWFLIDLPWSKMYILYYGEGKENTRQGITLRRHAFY